MRICGIYSNTPCETCEWYRRVGGITSLCSMHEGLYTLAHNLSIAAALCHSFAQGRDHGSWMSSYYDGFYQGDDVEWPWTPGCRIAHDCDPGDETEVRR